MMSTLGSTTQPRMARPAAVGGAAIGVMLATAGLLGWVTPWRGLASLYPGSIPMAPSTALALLLLGVVLFAEAYRPSPRLTTPVSLFGAVFSGAQLLTVALDLPPAIDAFLVRDPGPMGAIPTGRMSPWTALGLLLASLGLLLVAGARGRVAAAAGASLALAVAALGGVMTLGYLFGAPLLYGGAVVPIAFPTALALGSLGLALVGLAPPDAAPLRPFTGSTIGARLLRAFLPIAPGVLVVGALIDQVPGLNPALQATLSAFTSALVVAAFVSYAARGVGRELESAQAERDRTQQALRENEQALRVFFESDVAGIAFGDARRALTANDEFLRITGYDRPDLDEGRVAWSEITPAEFRDRDDAARREALARGACQPYEKQYVRKDGRRVWVMVSYALLDPETERNVGFVVDIEARKRAEEDLRRAEERFARVFQSNVVAIGIAGTRSGRLIDVNNRCAEFFGYTRDEMVGRTVFELGLWADPAERERLLAATAASGNGSPREAAFRRKSGEIGHALVSMEAVTLSGMDEPLNMVVLVDLTAHKRLEQQLLQSQKLEAVGRLAGGVAHDFHNVLGVILGYGELLTRHASGQQRRQIDEIIKAAQRAASLTRQLLAFSRKQIVEPRVLDLNLLLADLESMLARLIGEDVDLAIVPGADLGLVKVDPGHLEQVVMNLSVNARDAMPDGGLLRLETANVDLEADDAALHPPMTPGRYVMLAASDTGCGIAKENLPKVFEPFFTTKEKGQGTGLGLATVYGIVKQAGGFVWVYSEVGRGTTFKIYLPRVDERASPVAALEPTAAQEGFETILLVEDEASLRAITREILEEHGYRVMEAASGEEAIEISRGHPHPIHLLVTDVVMPGMNGRQVASALAQARPGLRVLYTSGYTDDVIAQRGVLESGTLFLAKPFTTQALLRRVREALAERDKADSE